MIQTHGDPGVPPPGPASTTLDIATVTPGADIPRDPARRLRLHRVFVRQRRWSRELDDLLDDRELADDLDELEPDYWRTSGMTLGVPERNRRGRELAAAGWLP